MQFLLSGIIGSAVGILGTGLGGALVALIKRPSLRLPGLMMGFSGGIMLGVVVFDLFPKAAELAGLDTAFLGCALGIIAMGILSGIVKNNAPADQSKRVTVGTGIIILLGVALHNLPEGIAIGSGLSSEDVITAANYGIRLSIIMVIHDVPEGIAISVPFKLAKKPGWKIIFAAALSGVPTGVGALIGYLAGGISQQVIALCIAAAGGAMLYLTVIELLPGAMDIGGAYPTAGTALVGIAGAFLMEKLI